MFPVAYDYQRVWPENQSLKIEIQLAHEITIPPTVAQQKANGFLAGYVTLMVSSGQPTLWLKERPVWRIPAVLKLPHLGEVGVVGTIDVDAQTGTIIPLTTEQITRMQEIADAIAAHFAPETTPTG
jgi:hypothetical protein